MSDQPVTWLRDIECGFGASARVMLQHLDLHCAIHNHDDTVEGTEIEHRALLWQIACAGRVFIAAKFTPSPTHLFRYPIRQGLSFGELVLNGDDGKDTAEQLVRQYQRNAVGREALKKLVAGRRPIDTSSEHVARWYDEDYKHIFDKEQRGAG